tara:strand:- start:67 stop:594 length:528 start_codon:yes stop_codon:yes gene_type:complete
MYGISQFSGKFLDKSPFKNVEEPKKPDSQEPLYSEEDWHKVGSVTDAAIKKGAGAYIEVSKSNKDKEEDKKDAAPKMSPFNDTGGQITKPSYTGGYVGGGDIEGGYYVSTSDMYKKIGDTLEKVGGAIGGAIGGGKGKIGDAVGESVGGDTNSVKTSFGNFMNDDTISGMFGGGS